MLSSRPGPYIIAMLLVLMLVLTAYLMWKLPEAEQMKQERKKLEPASFQRSSP
jgi:hypothetical protein